MKIEIVQDLKARMRKDDKYVEDAIASRVPIKKSEKTLIMTPEVFPKVFSKERLRIMFLLDKGMNIYQLAKYLDRKYEAVHRDIKYLEGIGVIKVKGKKKKIPTREKIECVI